MKGIELMMMMMMTAIMRVNFVVVGKLCRSYVGRMYSEIYG